MTNPYDAAMRGESHAFCGPDCTGEAARLSKMLFTAREAIEMFADVVGARKTSDPGHLRDLVDEIDAYRAEHGWSPHGFGGET